MSIDLRKVKRRIKRAFPFLARPHQMLGEAAQSLRYGLVDLSRVGLIGNSVGQEACSICQLRCPLCPTGKGSNTDTIGRGYLRLEKFREFVDRNPIIKHFELATWGEVFLNPEIKEIIRFAHERNLELTALSGANFNTVRDDVLESLVKYRFRALSVSIDGASSETYQVYRRRGDFNTVIRNVEALVAYKKKYGSEYPALRWQFVIMGHNEHELPLARKRAAELGMEFVPKLNANSSYSPIRDAEFVRRESGLRVASREEFRERTHRSYAASCFQLWHLPRINWDGRLLGCCTNLWGDFGNVFDDGFRECLMGDRYVRAKRVLMGREKPADDIPCSKCYFYEEIRKRPLTRLEIISGKSYRAFSSESPTYAYPDTPPQPS